jgi:hypothetical protein
MAHMCLGTYRALLMRLERNKERTEGNILCGWRPKQEEAFMIRSSRTYSKRPPTTSLLPVLDLCGVLTHANFQSLASLEFAKLLWIGTVPGPFRQIVDLETGTVKDTVLDAILGYYVSGC